MPYRYTTSKPTVVHQMFDELPGHRFVCVTRTDPSAPPNERVRYKAGCSCKWRGDTWRITKAQARRQWAGLHMSEVERQQRLSV